jgi:aquaporin Z
MNQRVLAAEALGTAVIVLGGVGSAVLAGEAIGFLGVALAFGLSLLCMAYAIGPISGCHVNPAITVAMVMGGKADRRDVPAYLVGQVSGALVGAAILYVIASDLDAFDRATGMGANGYGDHSPGGYSLFAVIVFELVFTALFAFVVLGTTRVGFPVGMGGLAAGFMLTLVHLVGIPISGTSVNPARSLGPALFAGGDALTQVWVFLLVPLAGGALAATMWRTIAPEDAPA